MTGSVASDEVVENAISAEELDRRLAACFASVPATERKLVTSHDAFGYFAKRYGIKTLVYFEAHETIAAALQREKNIKHWSREWEIDLIDAGKELIEKCEDLYERSGELVEDATHELSGKYRALHEHSKQLLDEAETILRRAKRAATGR